MAKKNEVVVEETSAVVEETPAETPAVVEGTVEEVKVNKDGMPIGVPLTEEQIAEAIRKQKARAE